MSLFSQKKESECVLVFDIGSGSVGGAIVLTSPKHPATILYSTRSDIPFQPEVTGPRLLSLMLGALSQVMLALTHEGFTAAGFAQKRPNIHEAIVSLSAPWVISKTSFLKLRNEKPLPVTERIFETLLHESQVEAEADGSDIPRGSIQIEQKLIKATLNGYETSMPYGREAREAEFAVFGSFSVPRVTEKVSDAISQLIHTKHVSFHSFSLAAFAVLRELYPSEEDFMLVDVSGEQTELSMVKKATLMETATFPFGKNRLVRKLMSDAGIPAGGASALFRLYAESSGTGPLFERAKTILREAQKDWQDGFLKTLYTFSGELFLPKTLFVTADADVATIFEHAIASENLQKLAVSPAAFQIVRVGSDILTPLVSWGPSQTHEPFIALVSAFANTLHSA